MASSKCPGCHQNNIKPFFLVRGAPIFSVVTVRSKIDALAVPRKDIELNFCNDCGFIFNRLFEPNVEYLARGYEDQQGYSATFMEYLARIAKHLITRYDLRGKKIIEIGCGKGDFLDLMVKLNGGRGVGIDPAYEEGRQTSQNLRFFRELFSTAHGRLPADFVACRHTLEHIQTTNEFLREIHASFGENTNTVFVFEVPQVERILKLNAFWDIYYEHCSYFSAGSLARIFRNIGFDVVDLYFDYGDQYLLLEAKAARRKTQTRFSIEESVEELNVLVCGFNDQVTQTLARWRNRLIELKAQRKRTVVWGGGSKAVGFLTNFADLDVIEYVVDINPHLENNFIPGIGKMYVAPGFLYQYQPHVVIIMNGVYTEEIRKTLAEMNLAPDLYSL